MRLKACHHSISTGQEEKQQVRNRNNLTHLRFCEWNTKWRVKFHAMVVTQLYREKPLGDFSKAGGKRGEGRLFIYLFIYLF